MTYNVFGGTLSLTQSINQSINLEIDCFRTSQSRPIHNRRFRDCLGR